MPVQDMPFNSPRRIALAILLLTGLSTASEAQSEYTMPPPTLNPGESYALPPPRVQPVSPANPNTSPGSTIGSAGTNPITGQPCNGRGSSATASGVAAPPGFGSSGVIGAC
jgi:hypothetical protein